MSKHLTGTVSESVMTCLKMSGVNFGEFQKPVGISQDSVLVQVWCIQNKQTNKKMLTELWLAHQKQMISSFAHRPTFNLI